MSELESSRFFKTWLKLSFFSLYFEAIILLYSSETEVHVRWNSYLYKNS